MKAMFISVVVYFLFVLTAKSQTIKPDSYWTLKQCIDTALVKNIQIQQSMLGSEIDQVNYEQSQAERFPSLNASASGNLGWRKKYESQNTYSNYSASTDVNLGLNASVVLFNGFRVSNSIRQKNISYKAGQLDVETISDNISLSVLEAYLQILYSMEQVENNQNQVKSTEEQLRLAVERLNIGSISQLDYLQVKSQLASEKSTLANSESNLAINKINLLQLMQIPANSILEIDTTTIAIPKTLSVQPLSDSVYNLAIENKPQIKSAILNEQIAELGVDIAYSGYFPRLSLNGGLSTGYTSVTDPNFNSQIANGLSPSVGLTLSVPIYQNRSAKTSVDIARIQSNSAKLNTQDAKDKLRKSVEQSCLNLKSAEKQYELGVEEYNSAHESYILASEKFDLGLMSSVDFLVQKTNLIVAENSLLQAKYNLIFSEKTVDYYIGKPLGF